MDVLASELSPQSVLDSFPTAVPRTGSPEDGTTSKARKYTRIRAAEQSWGLFFVCTIRVQCMRILIDARRGHCLHSSCTGFQRFVCKPSHPGHRGASNCLWGQILGGCPLHCREHGQSGTFATVCASDPIIEGIMAQFWSNNPIFL